MFGQDPSCSCVRAWGRLGMTQLEGFLIFKALRENARNCLLVGLGLSILNLRTKQMGNTVGHILISYDVNKLHTSVKSAMQELDYRDNFQYKGETKTYYLPNTTLWHPKKTSNQAIIDLQNTCRGLGVTLEKAIAVLANEFKAI